MELPSEKLSPVQMEALATCLGNALTDLLFVDREVLDAASWTYYGTKFRNDIMRCDASILQIFELLSGIYAKIPDKYKNYSILGLGCDS